MTSEPRNLQAYSIHCEGDVCRIIDVGGRAVLPQVPPAVVTIFGATGDLTRRKLMPALYDLARLNLLPPNFVILGYGRSAREENEFRESLAQGIQEFARLPWNGTLWEWLEPRIFYQQGDYHDAGAFQKLHQRVEQLQQQFATGGNQLFYIATPPTEFAAIIRNLGPLPAAPEGFRRLIVEKPFGRDLPSAHELNQLLGEHFSENDVLRIDHYLGKETVQNILVLRFANAIWEPLWNHHYIDHVQILVGEEERVGRRGGYYETSGAMRDMVVNHMLQLLALVAMEPPVALDANAIRDEKVKVLRGIQPLRGEDALGHSVRGQYKGYHDEPGVAPDSRTETFVALKLAIDSWRWAGVPFFLRHGKHLPARATEIVVRFKDTPSVLFNDDERELKSNMLILRIQPNEGFALRANAKVPGSGMQLSDVRMDFDYCQSFGAEPPEAYERLLHDALIGDFTLFTRRDEVEVAWSLMDPIIEAWQAAPPPHPYQQGSWGPEEADEFIARDGRRWHEPD